MTTPIPELKHCPFCGGEASSSGVINYHKKLEAWFIDGTRITQAFYCNCLSCTTSNRGMLGHQTREKAITAWNTRAAQAAQPTRNALGDDEANAVIDSVVQYRGSYEMAIFRAAERAHGIGAQE